MTVLSCNNIPEKSAEDCTDVVHDGVDPHLQIIFETKK